MSEDKDIDVAVDSQKGTSAIFSLLSHTWVLKTEIKSGFLVVRLVLQMTDKVLKNNLSIFTRISLIKIDGTYVEKSQHFEFSQLVLENGFDDFVVVGENFEAEFVEDNIYIFHISFGEKGKLAPLKALKGNARINATTPLTCIGTSTPISALQTRSVYSHSPTSPGNSKHLYNNTNVSPSLSPHPSLPIDRPTSSSSGAGSRTTSPVTSSRGGGSGGINKPGSSDILASQSQATSQALYSVTGAKDIPVSNLAGKGSSTPAGNKIILPSLSGSN